MARLSLSEAVLALQEGEVVAVPTETVYGLAASLRHPEAIAHLFALKGRPLANPLIIHLADVSELEAYLSDRPPGFTPLAKAFWPGALTCVLPIHPERIPSLVRAGLPTAGFRIPSPLLTRSLLQATGPLVMPSANLSGRPSATCPEHVEEDFGSDFPVLDGGRCPKGVESTILFYQGVEWVILRLGALSPESFEPVLGYQPRVITKQPGMPLCPGQLFRHYAPRARLWLGKERPKRENAEERAFVLGFKERDYPGCRVIMLGSLKDPGEVAENLYRCLRQLDQEGAAEAWVDSDFPRDGLWQTIHERLERAGEGIDTDFTKTY